MMKGRAFADLVPQHGAMVLLDDIASCDERELVATTGTHRDPGNPLASDGRLPIWAGIEYAAQAMAAHFSLAATVRGAATIGLLGGLRDVVCGAARLDDIGGPLVVAVERLSRDVAGSIYAFTLTDEAGGRELLRGRATVIQQVRGDQ